MGEVDSVPGVRMEAGVAARPCPGQAVSGDAAVVLPFSGGWLLGAIDGAGHGPEAARAAAIALEVLQADPSAELERIIARCHESMRGTRGAVLSLAQVRADALRWAGVGNVAAVLVSEGGGRRESLLLRNGVLGQQVPPPRVATLPLRVGDTLIFMTDGVRRGVENEVPVGLPPQQLAERALEVGALPGDDALVVVARRRGEW